MRPNTKENSENKQKCQYNDETIISQAVYQTEDRPFRRVLNRRNPVPIANPNPSPNSNPNPNPNPNANPRRFWDSGYGEMEENHNAGELKFGEMNYQRTLVSRRICLHAGR